MKAGTIVNLFIFDINSNIPDLLPFQNNGGLSTWEVEGHQIMVQTAVSLLVTLADQNCHRLDCKR
eukprot:1816620-Ditylum_brightwellii.AAC.1